MECTERKLVLPKKKTIIFIITKNCSFECAHCLRGDRIAETISTEVIDAILTQVNIKGTIHLGGGEPLLYIDRIIYLINETYRSNNDPLQVTAITNGSISPEKFEKLIAALSVNKTIFRIKVSNDYFHRMERIRLYDYESEEDEIRELQRRLDQYRQIALDYGYQLDNGKSALFLEEYDPYVDGVGILPIGKGKSISPDEDSGRNFSLLKRVPLMDDIIKINFQVLPDGKITTTTDMSWEEADLYSSKYSVLEKPLKKILTYPKQTRL